MIYATHIFDGMEQWMTHIAFASDGKLRYGGLKNSVEGLNGCKHLLSTIEVGVQVAIMKPIMTKCLILLRAKQCTDHETLGQSQSWNEYHNHHLSPAIGRRISAPHLCFALLATP